MKLFGRKNSAEPPAGPGGDESPAAPPVSHRLTVELQRAETLASMLARSRSSPVIEVSDFLAGMYICGWDRMSRYWNEYDQQEVEALFRSICRISPQRWHSWIELYDRQRRDGGRKGWRILRSFANHSAAEKPLRPSAALAAVIRRAEQIAPSHDKTGDYPVPILTSECVLLCIVQNLGSEISRKLTLAGLDVHRLERDALLPQRPPRA